MAWRPEVRTQEEQGMILVNVLMFVAIASGLVLLMISREELALDRSLRGRNRARWRAFGNQRAPQGWTRGA
jgi:general secretion pathway protein K